MELLTFIGQAARRKEDYVDRAQRLADAHPTLDRLEEEMDGRAEGLVRRLKTDKMTFTEFKRASAEDTLVSSLAGIIVGSGNRAISDTDFGSTMEQMKYLWNFFEDIQQSLDNGRLKDGEDFEEVEESDWYYPYPGDEEVPLQASPSASTQMLGIGAASLTGTAVKPQSLPIPVGTNSSPLNAAIRAVKTAAQDIVSQTRSSSIDATLDTPDLVSRAQRGVTPRATPKGPATWQGVVSRLKRFLVTPLYRWFNIGRFTDKQQGGSGEMRRVTRRDGRVCPDCTYYQSLGWVPIGSLPMPGIRCRCHDRCRCIVEYR